MKNFILLALLITTSVFADPTGPEYCVSAVAHAVQKMPAKDIQNMMKTSAVFCREIKLNQGLCMEGVGIASQNMLGKDIVNMLVTSKEFCKGLALGQAKCMRAIGIASQSLDGKSVVQMLGTSREFCKEVTEAQAVCMEKQSVAVLKSELSKRQGHMDGRQIVRTLELSKKNCKP